VTATSLYVDLTISPTWLTIDDRRAWYAGPVVCADRGRKGHGTRAIAQNITEQAPSSIVKRVFVDSGGFFALLVRSDDAHDDAVRVFEEANGDAFEREGDMREYFVEFADKGYVDGVNVILYALTH
jgi:hypothetical protein